MSSRRRSSASGPSERTPLLKEIPPEPITPGEAATLGEEQPDTRGEILDDGTPIAEEPSTAKLVV
ncbi:hypothetical protein LTS18_008447, partial [Coniosporium uncinatum]